MKRDKLTDAARSRLARHRGRIGKWMRWMAAQGISMSGEELRRIAEIEPVLIRATARVTSEEDEW